MIAHADLRTCPAMGNTYDGLHMLTRVCITLTAYTQPSHQGDIGLSFDSGLAVQTLLLTQNKDDNW